MDADHSALVRMARKPSMALSQEADVGAKWNVQLGWRASHRPRPAKPFVCETLTDSGDEPLPDQQGSFFGSDSILMKSRRRLRWSHWENQRYAQSGAIFPRPARA